MGTQPQAQTNACTSRQFFSFDQTTPGNDNQSTSTQAMNAHRQDCQEATQGDEHANTNEGAHGYAPSVDTMQNSYGGAFGDPSIDFDDDAWNQYLAGLQNPNIGNAQAGAAAPLTASAPTLDLPNSHNNQPQQPQNVRGQYQPHGGNTHHFHQGTAQSYQSPYGYAKQGHLAGIPDPQIPRYGNFCTSPHAMHQQQYVLQSQPSAMPPLPATVPPPNHHMPPPQRSTLPPHGIPLPQQIIQLHHNSIPLQNIVPPPQPAVPQVQAPNATGFGPYRRMSDAQADAVLSRPVWTPPRDDAGVMHAYRHRGQWYQALYDAAIDLTNCNEEPTAQLHRKFRQGKFCTQEQLQAAMKRLFWMCLDLYTRDQGHPAQPNRGGSMLPRWLDRATASEKEMGVIERLDAILDGLRKEKALASDAADGGHTAQRFVNGPLSEAKLKVQYRENNKNRRKELVENRELLGSTKGRKKQVMVVDVTEDATNEQDENRSAPELVENRRPLELIKEKKKRVATEDATEDGTDEQDGDRPVRKIKRTKRNIPSEQQAGSQNGMTAYGEPSGTLAVEGVASGMSFLGWQPRREQFIPLGERPMASPHGRPQHTDGHHHTIRPVASAPLSPYNQPQEQYASPHGQVLTLPGGVLQHANARHAPKHPSRIDTVHDTSEPQQHRETEVISLTNTPTDISASDPLIGTPSPSATRTMLSSPTTRNIPHPPVVTSVPEQVQDTTVPTHSLAAQQTNDSLQSALREQTLDVLRWEGADRYLNSFVQVQTRVNPHDAPQVTPPPIGSTLSMPAQNGAHTTPPSEHDSYGPHTPDAVDEFLKQYKASHTLPGRKGDYAP